MNRFVLASSNPGKLREFSEMLAPLGLEVVPQSLLGIEDAEEPHGTFVENALAKARHAARLGGLPALADDSGICAAALDGEPGVHSARYASGPGASRRDDQDRLNNEKLISALRDLPDRRAHYYCVIVLMRHGRDPQPLIAEGNWHGRIIDRPDDRKADEEIDVSGHIVMAGAIDVHSHIAGGGVNTARLLLPENHRAHRPRPKDTPLSTAGWSTFETGTLYAQMGFTTVIEPAILPHNALHAHLELADIPIIDKGFLAVLGNDDFLLSALRDRESENKIADYIGSTFSATRAIGVKCANPGGVCACKENVRSFTLDDVVPEYGLSSRQIFSKLQRAVAATKAPHPLHLHMSNLGLAGNIDTALATIEAAQGVPLHLAHAQFYAYGKEGKHGFSSSAAQFAEKINANPNITIDVGQVMFEIGRAHV